MKPSAFASVGFMVVALVACADKKAAIPPSKTPVMLNKANLGATGSSGSSLPTGAAAMPPGVDASVNTGSLHVSDSIARACDLPVNEARSHFDYDSSDLGSDDKEMLGALAKCLTEGPLAGRQVSLIGRADPRGEDEYNMALGGDRAESVHRYLKDLGVVPTRMRQTSRGEIDAVGTDETSWAQDRRVDIDLLP